MFSCTWLQKLVRIQTGTWPVLLPIINGAPFSKVNRNWISQSAAQRDMTPTASPSSSKNKTSRHHHRFSFQTKYVHDKPTIFAFRLRATGRPVPRSASAAFRLPFTDAEAASMHRVALVSRQDRGPTRCASRTRHDSLMTSTCKCSVRFR